MDRNDPNWAFTRAAREERFADIDRSLGYEPAPSYAPSPPPATAAMPAQALVPVGPGVDPRGVGQPYAGWAPPQQPAAQPDPVAVERERAAQRERELQAQNAQYQGVLNVVLANAMQREEAEWRARRDGLDPETAIYETDVRYQNQMAMIRQQQEQAAAANRAALMNLHVDGFTRELFDTLSLTEEQRQAVRDLAVNPYDPEPGANARASLAGAFHAMNERDRMLAMGNGAAIYTAAGVNRMGGMAPAAAPGSGYESYSRNPVAREIERAPYYGVR
jgi:hypothetical protein